jgi:hypothetical protein
MSSKDEDYSTDREQVKAQIAQDRQSIAKARTGIAEAQKHVVDSLDRLAESQRLIRRGHPRRHIVSIERSPR